MLGVGAMAPADRPSAVQFDEGRADFPVDEELGLDQGDLSHFLLMHSMHLVTEFNSQVSWAVGAVAGVGACPWEPAPISLACPCRPLRRSLRPGSSTTCCCSSTRRWPSTGSCWWALGRQLLRSGDRYLAGPGRGRGGREVGCPPQTPCWQVLFVVVDVGADNDHVLQYFGLKAEEAPTLRLINIETTKKYAPADGGPVTAASITTFCHAVLGGHVKVCC